MEGSDSGSKYDYKIRSTQINDDLWDEYSSTYESDHNKDKSYDSDKAAELLTSRFVSSRSDNNEQNISSDKDTDSNNKDDNELNT
eukprot:10484315-Ditylum_brightwellii.AAC.1